MAQPRVFIGSSTEALPVVKAIELQLVNHCRTRTWDSGVFRTSRTTIEDLEQALATHEFAILVLSPDDMVESRRTRLHAPRDNVIFELGLFVGRLGRKRTFVVTDPKKVKIPSDWHGVKVAAVDWHRVAEPQDTVAAVSPACTEILEAIKKAPPLDTGGWAERHLPTTLAGTDELYDEICSASLDRGAVVVAQDDTSWAWNLFPTLLEWKLSGISVTAYVTGVLGNEKHTKQEKYRRTLLDRIGVHVIHCRSLPVRGFFLGVGERDVFEAIILSTDFSGYRPLATKYDADLHWDAAMALLGKLGNTWRSADVDFRPLVRKQHDTRVCATLRSKVRQYGTASVKIRPSAVPTSDLKVISRFTRSYRYRQIERLAKRYRQMHIEPFKALNSGDIIPIFTFM